MWDTRKALLAALVFTALYYSVAAERATLLDMALDAVDYLFAKCRKEAMEKIVHSGLLRQELNLNTGFQKAWNGSAQCSKLIPGGIKEHTAALLAYANGDFQFIKTFNKEVKMMGGNYSTYENKFNFKALHFLLMDYMMLQKPKNCETAYVLPENTEYKAQKGSKVRLGRFTTAEVDFSSLQDSDDLEGKVILNITSCYFVKLGDNICKEEMGNVLLSPAEMFTVEGVNTRKVDDGYYTEIVLKPSGLRTTPSCHLVSRSPAVVSTQWLVLVLVASSLFFFIC
ncbi:putative erythroblast NAD(P)(+)--arginine ADP-ribosyltransferase-like [Scophthalmus maximus]|uniref:NAD(P)(+)--arginine ADP-ribosyltransferase n=1 Tax=Scophthalmus maximus TaxID=52904 RepID=A0A2U9BQA0_SCOMX|nr:GPI-linked NAD(P)(+)--arginine ADP-ribosyltransferase 1 [Scophthalmus maximus]AWP05532.1 putative erythroblast NAD(P)(+)--arginine ADP-ribosyltransferase-like [Scophthalmus maximus]